MKETAPYHRHYPKDHLAETFGMSWPAIGMYATLRDICWIEGSIPHEPAAIAKLIKVPVNSFVKTWAEMEHLFRIENGRNIHIGVEVERDRLDTTSGSRSKAGKLGADRRWFCHKKNESLPSNTNGKVDGKPMANGMAKNSIAVCSSQLSDCSLSSTEDKPTQRARETAAENAPDKPEVWDRQGQQKFLAEIGWRDVRRSTPEQIAAIVSLPEKQMREDADLKSLYMIWARLNWFEEFWDEYWRKVDKHAGRIAYFERVTTLELSDLVIAAVVSQNAEMMRREMKNRPHASTWLNHGRWDDEAAPEGNIPLES